MRPLHFITLTLAHLLIGVSTCDSEDLPDSMFSPLEPHDDVSDALFADVDFHEEYSEEDFDSGGTLKFLSRGNMAKNILNVDTHQAIRKVKCDEELFPNIVMIALKGDSHIDVLVPGGLIIGGPHWGCPSEVDGSTWQGLLRRVVSIKERALGTLIEAYTESASFLELLDDADISYRYRPGERKAPVKRHRSKRLVVPDDNEPPPTIAQWMTTIDYSVQSGSAMVVDDSRSEFNFSTTNPEIPWKFVCEDGCNLNVEFGMDFELYKTRDDPITKYILRLNGTMSLDTTISTNIGAQLSKSDRLSQGESDVVTTNLPPITLAPAPGLLLPDLVLNISAKTWYRLDVDMQLSGPVDIKHRVALSGAFDLTIDITDGPRTPPTYTFEFSELNSTTEVLEHDIKGSGYIKAAFYPVMEIDPVIHWLYYITDDKVLHYFDISTPEQLSPKVTFRHDLSNDGDVTCLDFTSTCVFTTVDHDIKADVILFMDVDNGWWHEKLDPNNTVFENTLWEDVDGTCPECCIVKCFPPTGVMPAALNGQTIDNIVGEATEVIPSGNLNQLSEGGDIVFLGENALSGDMALRLLKLVKLTAAKWQADSRKLVVTKGWLSALGLSSEGRLLEVVVSQAGSDSAETDTAFLGPLGELAVCAGFPYVQIEGTKIVIAVRKSPEKTVERLFAEKMLEEKAPISITQEMCDEWSDLFPSLGVGEIYPAGATSPTEVCGAVDAKITRMEPEKFNNLYHYTFDDVTFTDAENGHAWCTSEARVCTTCDPTAEEPFSWCADRVMTITMGYRLRRLATLVSAAGGTIKVNDAWHETTSDVVTFPQPTGFNHIALNYEGRAATLGFDGTDVGTVASAAACAGFDYVQVVDASTVYVCSKKGSGEGAITVPFLSNNLVAVDLPVGTDEYDYPEALDSEPYKTLLFDSNQIEELDLSRVFKVKDFAHSDRRYFRLDPELVTCLTLVAENVNFTFATVQKLAYRTRSFNNYEIDKRHPKETWRYRAGQAAMLEITSAPETARVSWMDDPLLFLASTLVRRCATPLGDKNLGVGVGIHDGGLYVDIRINPAQDLRVFAEYWYNAGVSEDDEFSEYMDIMIRQISLGGPEISPTNEASTCSSHPLGEGKGFYSFRFASLRPECASEDTTAFCTGSESHRVDVHDIVKKSLYDRTTFDNRLHEYVINGMKTCFTEACGPCAGDGPVWETKVRTCIDVINFYMDRVSQPSFLNNFCFFNLDTDNEEYRNLCTQEDIPSNERTQMSLPLTDGYLIFANAVNSLYRPKPEVDSEEYIYGSSSNPSPVLAALEMAYAMQVAGNVTVIFNSIDGVNSMMKMLKVLFAYNNQVDFVHIIFYDMPLSDVDIARESIVRRMEIWSGTACPRWSRSAIAPFTIEQKETVQRRRRRATSPGEYLRRRNRNWEIEWALRSG